MFILLKSASKGNYISNYRY